MTDNQSMIVALREEGICDEAVLTAMALIDRKDFVLPADYDCAYENHPLPIEESQTISQPYIVAYMTAALKLKSTDRVLEVGTGSGYQTAILSQLCHHVYTLEIFDTLYKKAKERFHALGIKNITAYLANGYEGLSTKAPFDAIIVTAAPEKMPEILLEQLAEGGRLCLPLGALHETQELLLFTKVDGEMKKASLGAVSFVPMI